MKFVTNRSNLHVFRLQQLQSIGWDNMTDNEKSEYMDYAAKGAYNYTDLNRVESNVAELASMLGLTLTTKTNWTQWDVPTESEMERYLGNVAVLRDTVIDRLGDAASDLRFPRLPNTMNSITFANANSIEEILYVVYTCCDDNGILGS